MSPFRILGPWRKQFQQSCGLRESWGDVYLLISPIYLAKGMKKNEMVASLFSFFLFLSYYYFTGKLAATLE